ncbi:hypothetical protein E2C01_041704 [Portunus trituberculatus]|uniref:Uncharacterized protein n=1 Tax=Portunus trituberculatus TaxID=210409 RepID=A0A5B7FSF2_PORTR|nr:hypothetical protein [Portunus trituberculatus]
MSAAAKVTEIKLREHLTTSLPTHHTHLHSVRDAGRVHTCLALWDSQHNGISEALLTFQTFMFEFRNVNP